jgi:DNA-binding IclR family transcriptional regulator
MLQTVDRALRLLLLYEDVDQEYRVGEMAAMLGVDKSSASRLAATLANRGFLERAPGSEAFRIGPELGRLGVLSAGGSHNLIELARRPMENLAAETAETVNLARLEDRKVVNIAQVDGAHLVGVGDWVGWKTEPHATANGKVLLAFTEDSAEEISLQTPLEAFTRQTITKVRDFRSELGRVRAEVFDALGRCRASLSVSGPVYRMPPARLPEIAVLCKKAAGEISASLGKRRSSD